MINREVGVIDNGQGRDTAIMDKAKLIADRKGVNIE